MARNRSLITAFLGLTLIATLSIDAGAQTTRRKTTSTRPTPTPTPARTEPEVISRADQYIDENGRVITPQEAVVETNVAVEQGSPNSTADLEARIRFLEGKGRDDKDEKQKRLALNLDILTKAEQRVESLRKQYFEMVEKEASIQQRLDTLELDLRPDSIERNIAFAGSLRPEALREARQKNLSAEKTKLQTLLAEVQKNKSNLDINVQRADTLVEKLRQKLEKEIDDALISTDGPENP